MNEQVFEILKIIVPIIMTALLARLQRKKDLSDIEKGKKKPSDFHHFIK